MKKHELLEVVIKLIGVYCFVLSLWGIVIIPMSIISFPDNYNVFGNQAISPLFASIYHILLFILSYVFIKKTDLIFNILGFSAQDEETGAAEVSISGSLSFWIRIIGLFYFVSSAPQIVSYIIVYIQSLDLSAPQKTQVIADSVQPMVVNIVLLILSLLFIFKNQYIEAMLTTKKS